MKHATIALVGTLTLHISLSADQIKNPGVQAAATPVTARKELVANAPMKSQTPVFEIGPVVASPEGFFDASKQPCGLTGYEAPANANLCNWRGWYGALYMARAKVTITQKNPQASTQGKSIRLAVTHRHLGGWGADTQNFYDATLQPLYGVSRLSEEHVAFVQPASPTGSFAVLQTAAGSALLPPDDSGPNKTGATAGSVDQLRNLFKAGGHLNIEVQFEGKPAGKLSCTFFELPARVTCP